MDKVMPADAFWHVGLGAAPSDRRLEWELILRCLYGITDRESVDIRRTSALDWDFVARTAAEHGILPLVVRRLMESRPPDNDKDGLKKLRFLGRIFELRTRALADELLEILDAFADKGIDAIPFKGLALASFLYGDVSLRQPGDIDLLVHRDRLAAAAQILIERGYAPRVPVDKIAEVIGRKNGVTFEHERGNVDLHWTLDDYPFVLKVELEDLWDRSITIPFLDREIRHLDLTDLLHYLCVHGNKHNWVRLIWVADVAYLIHDTNNVDWVDLYRRVREVQSERILNLALYLAQEVCGAVLPESARTRIASSGNVLITAARQVAGFTLGKPAPNDVLRYRLRMLEPISEKLSLLIHRFRRAVLRQDA